MPELKVALGVEGLNVLVIGGARGIGEAVVRQMHSQGASVVVADIAAEAAASLATELSSWGAPVRHHQVDVASEAGVEALVKTVRSELGSVDVLVHVAGIGSPSPVVELSLEQWQQTLAVNLTGPFLTTRAVIPSMVAQGFGRIVLISSQLAFLGSPGLSHYCATKAGLHGFLKSVARELGDSGVTINAVAPGPTDTPLFRELPEEVREAIKATVPLGRIGEVDEIAPSVLLLASRSGGAFYTGAVLTPCGGHAMPA
ncbi:3-oxoacyl-[acyl-carrier protein] reductase [Nocardioides ginsengisegetis]|uniref:3-oxoacyl-[acyl-carrier protein] reductase n=1 Tax=Nocardioides ginsengisegetis TaxID=661491 RepID=A0A7W3IZ76_9ACTN|nr:SDR family oxidoreductase [Nocardioides ginsengisegetis]MBA8803269.1 3-oxoacyl-[acyl-carrier protein] reductase [Nocardioides ginsengisegetis]